MAPEVACCTDTTKNEKFRQLFFRTPWMPVSEKLKKQNMGKALVAKLKWQWNIWKLTSGLKDEQKFQLWLLRLIACVCIQFKLRFLLSYVTHCYTVIFCCIWNQFASLPLFLLFKKCSIYIFFNWSTFDERLNSHYKAWRYKKKKHKKTIKHTGSLLREITCS